MSAKEEPVSDEDLKTIALLVESLQDQAEAINSACDTFTDGPDPTLKELAAYITDALDELDPLLEKLNIIAERLEPGDEPEDLELES